MESATKLREHLWIKGGIYFALALIISGAFMLMASANMAFADTVDNKDGSKTETVTVKRTITFSDGAGGQVADTVVQEATFTRTWYPEFEQNPPAWETVTFAAVPCPAVSNYRANQTQVDAVSGVSPDNASSTLRDVTVTYTKLVTNTPATTSPTTTSPTTTSPTVTSPTVTQPSSSAATTVSPTTTSTTTTVTPTTTTTTTGSSSSSTVLPSPTTVPTVSTTAVSSSSSTLASSSSSVSPVSSSTAAPQQGLQFGDSLWQIAAAALAAGLIGGAAYILSTRRRNENPVEVPSGEPKDAPSSNNPSGSQS